MIKQHPPGGLKQEKSSLPQFWRAGGWSRGMSRATLPPEALGSPSLASSSFGGLLAFLGSRPRHRHLCPVSTLPSARSHQPFLSPCDKSPRGCTWGPLDNPGPSPHLEVLKNQVRKDHCHPKPLKVTITTKTGDNQCWRGRGEEGTLLERISTGAATTENAVELPRKIKNRTNYLRAQRPHFWVHVRKK